MNAYHEKLKSIKSYYNLGDINLAFRYSIDCVIECGNSKHINRIIELAPLFADENYEELKPLGLELVQSLFDEKFEFYTDREPLVKVQNVGKSFSRFTLSPVSLNLYSGDVWGLVGENGNGKTTLLRILAADLSYDRGSIDYQFSKSKSNYDLRTELVYIEQRTPRYFGSIKDNLKFAAAQYGIRGKENEQIVLIYLIRFGLWNYKGMKWSELSSGYKMRFELAKTFLRKPKILLLDEPLANLDILTQQVVLEDLKNISSSLTNPIGIILSSQQLFEVEKIANQVLFLKKGEPTLLDVYNTDDTNKHLYLELDVNRSKAELTKLLEEFDIIQLEFNGGVYFIEARNTDLKSIMIALFNEGLDITYLRDISKSSRRLFNVKKE